MKRDAAKAEKLPDHLRKAVGLPIGEEGEYFVGGRGFAGQDHDASITNYNTTPAKQPGLWCQWIPGPDGDTIIWDGGEKFYSYVEWLRYLIDHFLKPWGYVLNGEVQWQGEESSDNGTIFVKENGVWTSLDVPVPENRAIAASTVILHDTVLEMMAADHESEHKDFPRSDWQYEAKQGNTSLGYWEWLSHRLEDQDHDAELKCSECGASTEDGEGYDGLCGNCADKKEKVNE